MMSAILVLLFLAYFRNAALWMVRLFTSTAFQAYGVAFAVLLIFLFVLGYVYRKKIGSHVRYAYSRPAMIGLIAFLSIDLLNTAFFRYQIISAACFLLAGYCLLGFYMERSMWRRGIFLVALLTLTLPFIEHIQTFLGFPVRLFTAKIVSSLMHGMGISSLSDATVILTENRASIVDIPCSGVKSIYTGAVFLCVLYFFQRITFSWRMLLVTLAYLLSLLFFNVWRVFSLVYIYDVLQLEETGDALHIVLGIGGFIISGFLAWLLTKKYLSPAKTPHLATSAASPSLPKKRWLISILLVSFLFVDTILVFFPLRRFSSTASSDFTFHLNSATLQEQTFTEQEKRFFNNREVVFSKKYEGRTSAGTPFTLLLVSSKSWRTHHNPEVCLQGLGYHIDRSELRQFNDKRVRQVTLTENRGIVLYWFTNGETTISDYSERVWSGIVHPNQTWTLVEIGLSNKNLLENSEMEYLLQEIDAELTNR